LEEITMQHPENHNHLLIYAHLRDYPNNCKKPKAHLGNLQQPNIPFVLFIISLFFICILQTPASAVENQTFTCGIILPLSGEMNASGIALLQGIEIATDEINNNGGAAGHQISLRIADDEGSPSKALSLFNEMKNDGIPAVIGSYSTSITLPMAEETKNSEDIILISPRANGEPLYGISPRFYQINAPFFTVTQFVSDWLSYTAERVAIIYIDDEYGRSVLSGLESGLKTHSIPISGSFPITNEDTDFSGIFNTILNDAPDSIVISVYDSRQIPIIRNLSDAGYRGQVILTETGYINLLENEESEFLSKFSLFMIPSHSYLVPGERTDRFVKSFKDRFGQDPERTIAGYGYDSMMVLAYAIRLGSENGTISADSIQKGLDESRYYGITGPKTFDSYHTVPPVLDRWFFKDDKFILLMTSLT
jgi:branched-chain amino acid transport system substrate-binding protein